MRRYRVTARTVNNERLEFEIAARDEKAAVDQVSRSLDARNANLGESLDVEDLGPAPVGKGSPEPSPSPLTEADVPDDVSPAPNSSMPGTEKRE